MNQILTDEEVSEITGIGFEATGRAIEQAILNKLSEQKPLGWQGHSGHLVYDKKSLLPSTRHLAKPIYLHPAPSVSEGYQLVPIEPTVNQIVAGQDSGSIENSKRIVRIYKAMLAAARSK